MDYHLCYENYQSSNNTNVRNAHKPKAVKSKYGEFQVEVPQDRERSFSPQIVQNVKKIFHK